MIDKSPATTLERKPNAARRPEERLMHQEIISREYLKGNLQAEIASALGLSIATVKRDLATIRERWLDSALRDFDALKAEQLAKIDAVEAEAWAMWSRSCERQVRTSTQEIEASSHPGCNTRTDAQLGSGEPRYLQITLQCVERRSRLLGLDAPQKIAQTDSKGQDSKVQHRIQDMSDEEIKARTRELQRLSADDMSDDEIKDMVNDMTRGRFRASPAPQL
jgi:ECF sigma factor